MSVTLSPPGLPALTAEYGKLDMRVQAFLETHPAMLPLLRDLAPHIQTYFGRDAAVQLGVPPPIDQEPDVLFARVQASGSPAEAMRQLERFDEEYWLNKMPEGDARLHVTLKFA